MTKMKTKLRVSPSIQLNDEMRKNIEKICGPFIDEPITPLDLFVEYEKKIDCMYQAYRFIAQTLPFPATNKFLCHNTEHDAANKLAKNIISLGAKIKETLSLPCLSPSIPTDILTYQQKLEDVLGVYTNHLLSIIIDQWQIPRCKAIEILNKADQYVLLQTPAQDISTLIPYPYSQKKLKEKSDADLLLIRTRHLDPLPPETTNEFDIIRACEMSNIQAIPEALHKAPYYQLTFFSCLPKDISSYFATLRFLNDLIVKLKGNSGPDEFYAKLSPNERMIIDYIGKEYSFDEVMSKLEGLRELVMKTNDQSIPLLKILPAWFLALPHYERIFIRAVLTLLPENYADVRFSSRMRSLPVVPNCGETTSFKLNEKGEEIVQYLTDVHISHPASREILPSLGYSPQLSRTYLERNLQMLQNYVGTEKKAILQTLITPTNMSNQPDIELDTMLREHALLKNKTINYMNHALNRGNVLLYTASNDPTCLELYNQALLIAKNSECSKATLLHNLAVSYKIALDAQPWNVVINLLKRIIDVDVRELFLSSMETLIYHYINECSKAAHQKESYVTVGTCMSTKDRKKIQEQHSITMQIVAEEEEVPQLFDVGEKRDYFCDVYACIHNSGHIEAWSVLNAKGSRGIKTLRQYLSAELLNKIEEGSHCYAPEVSDNLASTNEVEFIVRNNKAMTCEQHSSSELAVLTLTEEQVDKLYEKLLPFINSAFWTTQYKDLFGVNVLGRVPAGVKDQRSIFQKAIDKKEKLIQILDNIETRPKDETNREPFTLQYYQASIHFKYKLSDTRFDEFMAALESIHELAQKNLQGCCM